MTILAWMVLGIGMLFLGLLMADHWRPSWPVMSDRPSGETREIAAVLCIFANFVISGLLALLVLWRKIAPLVALMLLLCASAVSAAEPWLAYGQTYVKPGSLVLDPPPNYHPGVRGAITAWPYVVPFGKRLIITGYGVEGNNYSQTIFLWLGDGPAEGIYGSDAGGYAPWWDAITRQALYSIAGQHSRAVTGLHFELEPGTRVHIGIISVEPVYTLAHGWFVQGYLEDGP